METSFKGTKITADTSAHLDICLSILHDLFKNDYERFEIITHMWVDNGVGEIHYTTCLLEDENQTLTF